MFFNVIIRIFYCVYLVLMNLESVAWTQSRCAKAFGRGLFWSISVFRAPISINIISEHSEVSIYKAWDHTGKHNDRFENSVHWISWTNDNHILKRGVTHRPSVDNTTSTKKPRSSFCVVWTFFVTSESNCFLLW